MLLLFFASLSVVLSLRDVPKKSRHWRGQAQRPHSDDTGDFALFFWLLKIRPESCYYNLVGIFTFCRKPPSRKSFARKTFPSLHIFQNKLLSEITLFELTFPETTCARINICDKVHSPKTYFSELALARNYVLPKLYFSEMLRFAVVTFYTCQILLRPKLHFIEPASCSSSNAFVSGAEGMRFKSRTSQIGHNVANGLPPLRHFFEKRCVVWAQ